MAERASSKSTGLSMRKEDLSSSEAAMRYWAVMSYQNLGKEYPDREPLVRALKDTSAPVRIAAARALGEFGSEADTQAALALLLAHADWSKHDVFTAMAALDALTALGQKAAPIAAQIKALPTKGPAPDARYKEYIPRMLEELRARFP